MKTSHLSSTLIDLLNQRAKQTPNKIAYTFLQDGEEDAVSLTYAELDYQAKSIAIDLQQRSSGSESSGRESVVGERALLLYPSGLDYIAAFFGCLYANVLAVPLFPPHPRRVDERVQAISQDARPKFVLTTSKIYAKRQRLLENTLGTQQCQWIATDQIGPNETVMWQRPDVDENSLAYLQYTSGSTSLPKGVMVSHKNLLYNLSAANAALEHKPDDVMVSWLPLFHDMGLIFGILYPLYMGIHGVFMSPTAFIERPIRWLQAISSYKGTHSAAPNFAYDYCIEKISPEQRIGLDLRSWRFSANGAEPVNASSLDDFATAFEECGVVRELVGPSYGLAEATLKVTSTEEGSGPAVYALNHNALAKNRVLPEERTPASSLLVACGSPKLETKIVIANPETQSRCADDEVGEVWVGGPTVAQGYWQNEADTQEIFRAYLADSGAGPFLRTGDLGFLYDGKLFITGRLKDLIILRGRNHYPQDIELTAAGSHPAFRPERVIAFAANINQGQLTQASGPERLVVVLEVERNALRTINGEETIWAIRNAIAEQHDIQPYAVVLTKPANIPKTTSGKLQRNACRTMFLENQFAVIAEWHAESIAPDNFDIGIGSQPSAALLQGRLCQWLAERLQVSVASIDPSKALADYGLDSLMTFELRDTLYHSFDVEITLTDLFDNMTIEQLTQQILTKLSATQSMDNAISLVDSAATSSAATSNAPLDEHNQPQKRPRIRISI